MYAVPDAGCVCIVYLAASPTALDPLKAIRGAFFGFTIYGMVIGMEIAVVGLQVPFWQSRIVQGCRKRGKPVIVATNMLESMIENPTPTRAEVSDIAIAVREGADAIMLSGETAYGRYPFKSVAVMATVAKKTEQSMLSYQVGCYRSIHLCVLIATDGTQHGGAWQHAAVQSWTGRHWHVTFAGASQSLQTTMPSASACSMQLACAGELDTLLLTLNRLCISKRAMAKHDVDCHCRSHGRIMSQVRSQA